MNDIGGAVLGLVTGILYCGMLVWALKFTGMIIGKETLASTVLGRWLMNSRSFFDDVYSNFVLFFRHMNLFT